MIVQGSRSVKRPPQFPTPKPNDLERRCREFEARNEVLRRALLRGSLVSSGDTQH